MLSMRRTSTEAERTAAALRTAPLIKQAVQEMQKKNYEARQAMVAQLDQLRRGEDREGVAAAAALEGAEARLATAKKAFDAATAARAAAFQRSMTTSLQREHAIVRLESHLREGSDTRIDATIIWLDQVRDSVRFTESPGRGGALERIAELRRTVAAWTTGDPGHPDAAVPLRQIITAAPAASASAGAGRITPPDLGEP